MLGIFNQTKLLRLGPKCSPFDDGIGNKASILNKHTLKQTNQRGKTNKEKIQRENDCASRAQQKYSFLS